MRNSTIISFVRTLLAAATLGVLAGGCVNLKSVDPYEGALATLSIEPDYPETFPEAEKSGLEIKLTDSRLSGEYKLLTDSEGKASARLPLGSYRLVLSHKSENAVFNGAVDRIILTGEGKNVRFMVQDSKRGKIVIKEIYCGGCTKYPEQGNYQVDSYIILHNNSDEVQYLDDLCFGTLDPYTSVATNVWVGTDPETGESVFQDFVPVVNTIWQFGGGGKDFPLESGGDAVLVLRGAIDHAAKYPQSVNLNKADYFVCYNNNYFPNTNYHPAPGNNIREDHILNVLIKFGGANAFTFSNNSPAFVIFRPTDSTPMEDFVADASTNIVQRPGSTNEWIIKIPPEWVMDGVEVFVKGGANKKRIMPSIDAGAVEFSGTYNAHTLFRRTDTEMSEKYGFEVLTDTNNSSDDFYEREQQSLHE